MCLEIGQGVAGFRGFLWVGGLVGVLGLATMTVFTVNTMLRYTSIEQAMLELGGLGTFGLPVLLLAAGAPMVVFAAQLFLNDLFGYLDAPLRFDRQRRKVYVWSSRKQGPLVLDWDRIKVVAQSVGAPPYQVNQFRSVLLVDEDDDGEVRFEGRVPRIAQIGAALLNREATIGAYEYVRTFMERGPDALPPVRRHLVMRPRGWSAFVDILGICGGMMRRHASLPRQQRRPGWMVFGVLLVALFSPVLWPLQIAQGIAVKFTARAPKWPAQYEALVLEGGPMLPPVGSEPNDAPLLLRERLITGLWVGWALAVYGMVALAV